MTQPAAADEHEAISRALAGDRRAASWLVDWLTPVIQARVGRLLLARQTGGGGAAVREAVEDLTQDVFVALFSDEGRVIRRWDPQRGLSLRNFAGLVATRIAVSTLRSGRRGAWRELPGLLEPGDEESPPDDLVGESPEARVLDDDAARRLLDRVREELSPLGLDLFERLVLEQHSVEQVSADTGMKRDAVYAWRSRLLKRIREIARLLQGDEPEMSPARVAGGSAS